MLYPRFDLTYEGLKHHWMFHVLTPPLRFDLTYEGLKLPFRTRWSRLTILFWSYLWGIETLLIQLIRFQLPEFWSYLWGIETRLDCQTYRFHVHRFDLTYEGLKQEFVDWIDDDDLKFWSYLWGIETSNGTINTKKQTAFWSYLWGIETNTESAISAKRSSSFDLTYEGLKPATSWSPLPMRPAFWSYLWGIETG